MAPCRATVTSCATYRACASGCPSWPPPSTSSGTSTRWVIFGPVSSTESLAALRLLLYFILQLYNDVAWISYLGVMMQGSNTLNQVSECAHSAPALFFSPVFPFSFLFVLSPATVHKQVPGHVREDARVAGQQQARSALALLINITCALTSLSCRASFLCSRRRDRPSR